MLGATPTLVLTRIRALPSPATTRNQQRSGKVRGGSTPSAHTLSHPPLMVRNHSQIVGDLSSLARKIGTPMAIPLTGRFTTLLKQHLNKGTRHPISPDLNHFMNNNTPIKISLWFVLAFLGFLVHVAVEGMFLSFTRDSLPAEELAEITAVFEAPATPWILSAVILISMLPIALSLLVDSGGGWIAIGLLGAVGTVFHLFHYSAELSHELSAIGLLSILVHVLPSGWATVLAFRYHP